MGNSSVIWRSVTQQVGSLQGFRSERDMESFLMTHPSLIVGWDDEKGKMFPLKEQIAFPHSEQPAGRMDIIGIAKDEGTYQLLIFELKNEPITTNAVNQIKWYLENWKSATPLRKDIEDWIAEMALTDMNKELIREVVANPVGVLIGTAFEAEAITAIQELNQKDMKINGVRLARFKGEEKAEYYIIIEDQIGETVKRKLWTWQELIDKNAIELGDFFFIKDDGRKLRAKPDPAKAAWNWIFVLFDDESRKIILENEKTIKMNMHPDMKKKVEKGLSDLRQGKSIALTNATALAFFYFELQQRVYFAPTPYWIHEKSGRSLAELKARI